MLATSHEKIKKLEYPMLCTPKLDGIRALTIDGVLVSRSFKPIANDYIRKMCEVLPDGLDGELIVGDTFSETSSAVMSKDGEPDFEYHVFDYVVQHLGLEYNIRMIDLQCSELPDFVVKVLPRKVNNRYALDKFFDEYIADGYEGLIARPVSSPYDCKRSKNLIKFKRFHDSEAVILGYEERMHNENELEKDNFGKAKRSKKKENMVPMDTLGALLVEDLNSGIEFKIGTGFDDKLRKYIWNMRHSYRGTLIKYKYQKEGGKDKPRFPVFLGFRSKEDM